MAFKASNTLPADAYNSVKGAAAQLKINMQSQVAYMAANGADFGYLQGVYRTLERANNQFNALKATPGLAQFAKDQEDDQAYDVAAEFTAMQTAITSAMAWMVANVPTSATLKTIDQWGDESPILDTFTPAQTAGLRTELQAVIGTID